VGREDGGEITGQVTKYKLAFDGSRKVAILTLTFVSPHKPLAEPLPAAGLVLEMDMTTARVLAEKLDSLMAFAYYRQYREIESPNDVHVDVFSTIPGSGRVIEP